MKDVETHLPAGIALAGVLERADPRDRLVGVGYTIQESPSVILPS